MNRNSGNGQREPLQTPALVMTYAVAVVDKAALMPKIEFQSALPNTCPQEELDALLDKCRLASERQKHFNDWQNQITDIALNEEVIAKAQAHIIKIDVTHEERAKAHLERGARTELELSATDRQDRENQVTAINNSIRAISEAKARISVLEAKCRLASQPRT